MPLNASFARETATPALLVLVGPTGVGKSELSLQLAQAIDADILSVDSRQVFRRLDIGTAKPTGRDRARVRHHLLDCIEPTRTFSAGRFAAEARSVLEQLSRAGRPALLVGGSGLYLSALVDGLFRAPDPDESVRRQLQARCRTQGLAALVDELRALDPAAAAALNPGDEVRVLRALELALDGRRRARRWEEDREAPLPVRPPMICLTRPREALYRRIEARTRAMFESGWKTEVERLLEDGLDPGSPGLRSMGYEEVVAHLRSGVPLEETVARIQQRTRRYAKRQLTWFRRDRRLRWLDLERLGEAGARHRILRQWASESPSKVPAPGSGRPVARSDQGLAVAVDTGT